MEKIDSRRSPLKPANWSGLPHKSKRNKAKNRFWAAGLRFGPVSTAHCSSTQSSHSNLLFPMASLEFHSSILTFV